MVVRHQIIIISGYPHYIQNRILNLFESTRLTHLYLKCRTFIKKINFFRSFFQFEIVW